MPKSMSSTVAVALIAALCEVILFHTAINAQEYAGCFAIDGSGHLVDLNDLCRLSDRGKSNALDFTNFVVFQPIANGNLTEVKGVITNHSDRAIPLSLISFQLVVNGQILASSAAEVAAGEGLQPHESIKFIKLIDQTNLKDIPPSEIKVNVIQYQ